MFRSAEPGRGADGQGAEAAPEPYAASLHAPVGDAEAGSGLTAALACVVAAVVAFVLPILAVHLIEGPPPIVEDLAVAPQLQSLGRPAAVHPAYRVHVVPDVHFPASQQLAPTCEPEVVEAR